MEGFKVSMMATLCVGVILFNALLIARSEGVKLFSLSASDGWTQDCYYFTPLTIFVDNIDIAGECPVRVRVPGARP
jgi:hypothetical protein